jgi:uncharacterized membrane protein YkvA (DUF1232 family)
MADNLDVKATNKANEYANDPEKLNDLVDTAYKKAASKRNGPLFQIWDSLVPCFWLLRAYANGQYTKIPWQSLLLIIASVSYFVMPLDLIPDFIVALGLTDDAVLLAWTINAVKSDIDNFRSWEERRTSP